MGKFKFIKKILPIVLAMMMVISSFPFSFANPSADLLGSIIPLTPTQATITDETTDGVPNKVLTFDSDFSLIWYEKNTSIGRMNDGWWVGANIVAPDLDLETLKTAKYDAHYYGNEDWVTGKSFGSNRDSSDTDAQQFIQMWPFLNEYSLNKAKQEGTDIVNEYRFDWDGNGTIDQYFTIVVKPENTTLTKNGETVYPSTSLGTVSAITAPANMTIEGSSSNYVTIVNSNDLTLSWSKADASIGRTKDAWWAGVKITAPDGMTQAQLEQAKLIVRGSAGWSTPVSFWDAKDSLTAPHWTGLWVPVDENDVANAAMRKYVCLIDWDADSTYEQMINFTIDASKVTLDKTNLFAMDQAKPVFTDMTEDAVAYVGDASITLEGKVVDMGTEDNGVTYTSGINSVSYAMGAPDAAKQSISINSNGEFSIDISEEFEGFCYFFATDNAGNESEETKVYIMHDTQVPTLEDVELSNENWTKDDLIITGKALDSLSGVDKVGYVKVNEDDGIFAAIDSADKLTGTTTVDDAGAFSLTIPADDYEGLIAVFAFDNVNRRSDAKVFSVKMDKTGFYSAAASAETAWVGGELTVEGTFSVALSGLKTIEYKKDGASASITLAEENITFETGHEIDRREGNYSFVLPADAYSGDYIVYFTDRAGNTKEVRLTVHMDNVKPVITNVVATPATPTNGNVIITGSFSDNLSGMKELYYRKNNESAKKTDNLVVMGNDFSVEIPKEDYYGFYQFFCVDNADNESEALEVEVKMDITAPEAVTIEYAEPVASIVLSKIFFYKEKCEVTLSAKDNLSTIRSFTYTLTDGTMATISNTDERFTAGSLSEGDKCTFEIPAQFRGAVSAYATDTAGNNNTNTVDDTTVIADTVPAVLDAAILTAENNLKDDVCYYAGDVEVKVIVDEINFMDGEFDDINDISIQATITDENDAVSIKDYTIEQWTRNPEGVWEGCFTISDEGDYVININYTDKSENVSLTKQLNNITIDKTAPVIEISYEDDVNSDKQNEGFFRNRTATITVNEHNFDKEYFAAQITAKNIFDEDLTTAAQTALAENNWVDNGNTHTLTIPYTTDANYSFTLNSLVDLAQNTYATKAENEGSIYLKGTEAPDAFCCDETSPANVTIEYKDSLIKDILDFVTLGISEDIYLFHHSEVEVTLTSKDTIAGVDYFKYTYDTTDATSTQSTPGANDHLTAAVSEEDTSVFSASFTIPAQFRGKVSAIAVDKSANASEEVMDGKTVVADTITPQLTVDYSAPDQNRNGVDYYKGDVTVTLTMQEENFMDGEYPQSLKDIQIAATIVDDNKQSTNENYTVDNWQRDGESDTWIGSFVLSTEGDYTLSINYQDRSKNTMDTYVRDKLTIDKTAPVVSTAYNPAVQTVSANGKSVLYYNETNKPGLVITVVEHNFDAADFVSKIVATDVSGTKHLTEAENFFTAYLKKDSKIESNWIHNGNTHTIAVPLENYQANYVVDYDFVDLAKNSVSGTPENATYDTAAAKLELSINAKVIRKVLNGITFGIFNEAVPANVTISASDAVAGIETIQYASRDVDNKRESIATTTLTVKNPLVNNAVTTQGVLVENNGNVSYSFTIPAEYRNGLQVDISDYSKNASAKSIIVNKDQDDDNTYDGIIKDETPGTIEIGIPATPDCASADTFKTDFDFTVELADTNAGIGAVDVKLNGHPIDFDADGKAISSYYEGDQLIRSFDFNINTKQIAQLNDEQAMEHGAYTLEVVLTDNAGNKIESEKTAFIDVFAPKISHFSFESDGKAFVGNKAYTMGEKVNVVAPDTQIYYYYFESVTYVTVYAYDIDESTDIFNEHTCGIADIELMAVSHTGETVQCEPVDGSFVQNADKVGYSTKTFKVTGPFKGDLYAIAVDKAYTDNFQGNTPTNDKSRGLVDKRYVPLMSTVYEGYVNPYDTVLEDMEKHLDTSDITIEPVTQADHYQSYSYTDFKYEGEGQPDTKLSFNSRNLVPLYDNSVEFSLTVSDSYSGIKEVKWSVVGQENQDVKNNISGRVAVNNLGGLSDTDEGWQIQSSSQNVVTQMTKNIVVKNNSNDIVILVELTDRSGNISYDYYVLGIDRTAPQIKTTLSGTASNKMYFNTDRTVTIEVTERNFDPALFNLVLTRNLKDISLTGDQIKWKHSEKDKKANDETVHTAILKISRAHEGDYTLLTNAKDRADNANAKPKYIGDAPNKFIIDSTPSDIKVSMTGTSANEKYFFNTDRTVTIVVTDRNFNPAGVSLIITANSSTYSPSLSWKQDQSGPDRNNLTTNTATFTISAEADYTFNVTCKDLASNNSNATKYETDDIQRFTIDKTAPIATIEQMVYQSANNGLDGKKEVAIPIRVTVKDTNIGNLYNSNSVSSKELTESLTFATLSASNNSANSFKQVSSARNKVVYGSSNLLDDGIYTLHLTAKDCAGNPLKVVHYIAPVDKEATKSATQSISNGTTMFFTFSVNRNGSTFKLGSYAADLFKNAQKIYIQNVEKDIVFVETNVDKLVGSAAALKKNVQISKHGDTLDADKYIKVNAQTVSGGWTRYTYTIDKNLFKDETDYVISIVSKDSASNSNYSDFSTNGSALKMIVDRHSPTVEIIGVSDKQVYAKESQHVKVVVSDDNLLNSIEIFVNNKRIQLEEKDFNQYFVDGQFVWEYDFKESKERQSIEVKCWDAANNKNFDEKVQIGDTVENFLVSTSVPARIKFWINNNIPWFVLMTVGFVALIVTPIAIAKAKKRKKDEE